METIFILWALLFFVICIGKGFSTLRKRMIKSLDSFTVSDQDKPTSLIRVYRFDMTYDPQSFFYRIEREIMMSPLPNDLIKLELSNLREQYAAYLKSSKK